MKARNFFPFAIAMAVAAFFLFAYAKRVDFNGNIPKEPPEYSDPAKAIETVAGKEFIISLESNPTTGYGWRTSGKLDESLIKAVEIRHRRQDVKRVGAGGQELWTFRGLREGTVTVPFEYVRSWEKGVPPVKRASFTIVIKK